jgi:hypothetical protein
MVNIKNASFNADANGKAPLRELKILKIPRKTG